MTERVFPDVKFVDEPEPMPKGAELVYATDPASNEGDFTTAVGGCSTRKSTLNEIRNL